MKRILAYAATFGISPTIFYIILVCGVFVIVGLFFGFCGGNDKPIAPVDPVVIEGINSRNTETRNAALDKAFESADAPRRISDEKRNEIRQEIDQKARLGRPVTAEDFRQLLKKKEGEQ